MKETDDKSKITYAFKIIAALIFSPVGIQLGASSAIGANGLFLLAKAYAGAGGPGTLSPGGFVISGLTLVAGGGLALMGFGSTWRSTLSDKPDVAEAVANVSSRTRNLVARGRSRFPKIAPSTAIEKTTYAFKIAAALIFSPVGIQLGASAAIGSNGLFLLAKAYAGAGGPGSLSPGGFVISGFTLLAGGGLALMGFGSTWRGTLSDKPDVAEAVANVSSRTRSLVARGRSRLRKIAPFLAVMLLGLKAATA